jgi:hypothetical protein
MVCTGGVFSRLNKEAVAFIPVSVSTGRSSENTAGNACRYKNRE